MVLPFGKLNIKTSNKVFLSYLFTFTVPLLIMGLFCYIWMMGKIYIQTEKEYINLLNNTEKEIEKKFQEVVEFSDRISQTGWLRKLALMSGKNIDYTRLDVTTLNDYLNEISSFNALNNFIEEIAIYIMDKDIVLYSDRTDNFYWFFTYTYKFEQITPEEWTKTIEPIKPYDKPIIKYCSEVSYYGKKSRLFTFIRSLPIVDKIPKATLFVFINEESIRKYLEMLQVDEQSSICIYGGNNEFITGINYDSEQKKLLEREIAKINNGDISRIVKDRNGKKYFLYSIKGKALYNEWRYVTLLPYDKIMGTVEFIKYVTLFLSIGLLAAGILFSYGLAVLNHKPVRKLILLCNQTFGKIDKNEYCFLENEILKMREQERNIKEEVSKMKEIELRDAIVGLINGHTVNKDKMEIILAKNDFKYKIFTVAIFEISESVENRENFFGTNDWTIYLLKLKDEIIAVINYDDENLLYEIIEHIREMVINDRMAVGVGRSYPQNTLWKSYNEAKISLAYKILKGDDKIINFEDISPNDEEYCYFPVGFDDSDLELLQTENCADRRKYLNAILNHYILQNQIPNSIKRYLYYQQTAKSLEEISDVKLNEITDALKNDYKVIKTTGDQQKYMEKIFKMIYTMALKKKEKYDADFARNIKQFIDDNYANPCLSLNFMADAFHTASYHMSRLCKECLGENFTDYLSKYRIRIAKKLLEEKHICIEDVGKQVGYENALTFRRAFKKYENQVPGQYRQQLSHIESKDC